MNDNIFLDNESNIKKVDLNFKKIYIINKANR
jgi:hypothetical protein